MFIVLHGLDGFTSRVSLAKLLANPRFAYNIERFDGAAADLNAIRMACETLPFLAEARLIVVDGLPKPKRGAGDEPESAPEPEPAAKPGKKSAKKPSAAALAREFTSGLATIAASLPPTSTLTVIVEEELPATHPLFAAAQRHGKLLLAAPPAGAALDRWIAARVKAEDAAITPDAAQRLALLTVGDLRLLASEITKLATYVGRGGTIDAPAVAALVPDHRVFRVFDLTDALARGERAAALALLHTLLADGEQPLGIVAMVARQVRVLIQVKDLAAQQQRSGDIAAAVGMQPYLVEKAVAQARRFSFAQLAAAQAACLDVDTALKRSRMAPTLALDLLIAEFGNARSGR